MKLYIGLSLQREFIDLVLRNDFVNSQWTRMLESGSVFLSHLNLHVVHRAAIIIQDKYLL